MLEFALWLQMASYWTLARVNLINVVLADVDVNATLYGIVGAFAGFVGGAAALSLLYAGYLLMFAGDNQQQEVRAKQAIGAAIIGGVVALAAVTLAKLITSNVVNTK